MKRKIYLYVDICVDILTCYVPDLRQRRWKAGRWEVNIEDGEMRSTNYGMAS